MVATTEAPHVEERGRQEEEDEGRGVAGEVMMRMGRAAMKRYNKLLTVAPVAVGVGGGV